MELHKDKRNLFITVNMKYTSTIVNVFHYHVATWLQTINLFQEKTNGNCKNFQQQKSAPENECSPDIISAQVIKLIDVIYPVQSN